MTATQRSLADAIREWRIK